MEVCRNIVLYVQDMLQSAGQYRETKASMYRASENEAAEPEYIPWTGNQPVALETTATLIYN